MSRWTCSIAFALMAGCVPDVTDPPLAAPPQWQDACASDSDCGELACLCGVCSVMCDTPMDCFGGSDCVTVGSGRKDGGDTCALPATARVCVSPCQGDDCDHTEVAIRPSGVRPSEAVPIPECPVLAPTTGLPLFFFHTEIQRYVGPATVNQRTETQTLVLALNESAGDLLELRFNEPLPDFLPLGHRVHVDLRSGGSGSEQYHLLVLRDDRGELLIASHSGDDVLYQDGLFATPDALGFSLELTIRCASQISGGCFENQVQASYAGTFHGDEIIAADPSGPVRVHIDGKPYDLSFGAESVDGGERLSSCPPDITPGRYLELSLIRRER